MFIRKINFKTIFGCLRNPKMNKCYFSNWQDNFRYDLNKNYYDILDIPKDASNHEINNAYSHLAS